MKKDNKAGSVDALSGATISSRAYADAMQTAYAAFLWTTGQREQFEKAADAPQQSMNTGATKSTEPEARKGETDNE